MSDIRAQSRRDAEFDRLLDIISDLDSYNETAMRDAYEMGKRHGAEMIKGNRRPLSDERKAYAQLEEME